jgi:hypothetical protein
MVAAALVVPTLRPGSEADPVFVTWTAEDVSGVELDIVRAIVAIVPFAIVEEFIPQRIQVRLPAIPLQEIALPAAVAALAAVTETAEKSVVEWFKVHCRSEGRIPDEFTVRLRVTVLPGAPNRKTSSTRRLARIQGGMWLDQQMRG